MFNKKGHITVAILVLLLGAVVMMFFLFRSGRYQHPTNIEEWLLRNQSVERESSLNEPAQRAREPGSGTEEGRLREETGAEMEKSKIGVDEKSKEPAQEELSTSTPIRRETKTLKRTGEPRLEGKDSSEVVQEELDFTGETAAVKEDHKGPKKSLKQGMIASVPPDKEAEESEKPEEPKFGEKSSRIDVFEKAAPNAMSLKEEVEPKKSNSSEKASLRQESFTVVSKEDIAEIQRKCWAALELLKE